MSDMGVNPSNTLRITGLATGMDTDDTVSKMTLGEKYKVDKAKQVRQTMEWKQELYRDITKEINNIKNEYLDVLGDNYILSESGFSEYSISYGNTTDNSFLTVSAQSGALEGNYSVEINQVAKAATISSTSSMISNITTDIVDINTWKGASIAIDIGGTEKTITLGSDFTNISELAADINNQITADSSLNGKLYFNVQDGTKLKINTVTTSSVKITSALQLDGTTPLGEVATLEDKIINPNLSTTLSSLDSSLNGNISFDLVYNGTTTNVSIDNTDGSNNIDDVIDAIREATSGNVIASYSELTGKFSLKTSNTGSATSIKIAASVGSLGETLVNGVFGITLDSQQNGQDSIITVTPPGEAAGTTISRATNVFTIDGIQYNLTKETTSAVDFTVEGDSDKTFDKIKGFIDKYNEMIEKIYTKVEEKRQYSYDPLTDEEKESMTDEQIEKWETKAKEGLLRNDSDLSNLLNKLRAAFFAPVDGAGITFNENQLGIGTSSDIGDRGKIVIKDEDKFKQALENYGEQITRLFVKPSDVSYSRTMSSSDRETRYEEVGIFHRISDLLNDYTSTYRDSDGNKGILIEKAGIENDLSFVSNTISEQIKDQQEMIDKLTDKLYSRQDYYYKMFAQLESSMNNLNAQSNWLYSQLGMSQG